MAKSSGPPEKKKAYAFPSRFGSHLSMLNINKNSLTTTNGNVILTDKHGDYETHCSRLDSGLADPNRYGNVKRLSKLFANNKKD